MQSLWKVGLAGVVITTGLISCLKPEQFAPEPEIRYKSFEILSDSAKLTITFQDGDGDIGLNEGDTMPPYEASGQYHYNLIAEYWEKDDVLGWVQGEDFAGDPIVFQYRTPHITPEGQNKALKGEIEMTLEPLYYNTTSAESDTIKYKIQLIDRALNESNWVESEEIVR